MGDGVHDGGTRGGGGARAGGSGNSAENRAPLTVVIPTLGRPVLERALDALEANAVRPERVIVIDQGRSAAVAALARASAGRGLDVLHVPSDERGRARAVNRGLERVTTRFAAVTDDDCLASPDWIASMRARLERHADAIVTGRVEPGGDGPQAAVVVGAEEWVMTRPGLGFRGASGGNVGFAMETLARVGPYDEDPCLQAAEDNEWSHRALRRGVSIVYAPEVVVRHLDWRDAEGRQAQYASYARSHGGFYGKILRQGDALIAARIAVHYARALTLFVRGVLTGDADARARGGAYLRGLLPGILAGLRSREPAP